ncbi:MAG TPA: ABC transporter substrate-binding protein [Azospirillum sp.]|nr:ABC transporter substrate-binding protein [Azospirillum sp.]
MLHRVGAAALLALSAAGAPAVAQELDIRIAVLAQEVEPPPTLANLDPPPEDEGVQGARLATADSNTTGKFLKHRYRLDEVVVPQDGDVAAAMEKLAADGHRFVVSTLRADALNKALAAPGAAGMLVFNAAAPDDALRNAGCRANLLHTLPSRAMLADALAQVLVKKRWTRWFLVTGPRPEDALYADAVRRAAKRFGAKVVAEKAWTGDSDVRRTAQAEVATFTQGPSYDVLVVADEAGDFGNYLPYQTWDPRPVAGTAGLIPAAWGRAIEAWGAVQLQERFRAQAGRWMTPADYAAWIAVRTVAEAATRTKSGDPAALAAAIRADGFEVGAHKGRRVSYRPWDGQLRQPIPLLTPVSLVAEAPQEGFLHPTTDLDTLGHDRPESGCKAVK